MSSLWLMTMARVREFVREPGAMFWTFGFPVLITVALGLAFRQEGAPKVNVAVLSEEVATILRQSKSIVPTVMSKEEMELALRKGRMVIGVETSGSETVYYMDPARPNADAVRLQVDDLLQRAAGRVDPVSSRTVVATQPGGRHVDWLVPGLIGMQIMSGGMWGVGWVVVEFRQRKLLKRLVATPMKRTHFLLSFLLARLFAVGWELVIVLGFAALAFSVHTQGSLVSVTLVSVLGAASFAGLGLLCACRAQNTQTAGGLMNLMQLPMFVLSGVFFSSVNFPSWMQPIIHALPLTAFNDALRGIINDGASLFDVAPRLLVVFAWGVVAYVVSLKVFRWI